MDAAIPIRGSSQHGAGHQTGSRMARKVVGGVIGSAEAQFAPGGQSMSLPGTIRELVGLTVDERLALLEMIWKTIEDQPDQLDLTGAQKEELDRRLADHNSNPISIPWSEVKAAAIGRSQR